MAIPADADDAPTISTPSRVQRRARERTRTRSASPASGFEAREQLKTWLELLDAVLRAIETVAWEARGLGDTALGAAEGLGELFARLAVGGRARAREGANRVGRITAVGLALARVAAAYRLHTTKAAFLPRAAAEAALARLHEQTARRLYELCVEQGGGLLKVAQILSTRPDLLPEPFIRELGRLQDAAPPLAIGTVMCVIEEDLGSPSEQQFAAFDPEPVAAASIGQVHRATLHDGSDVAVKVQRPQVASLIELDLDLLEHFARALADALPPIDLDTIIDETRAMILAELDYAREAELTERAAAYFAEHPHVRVPRVRREHSGSRVLVTTFVEGEKITERLDALLAQADGGSSEARERITTLLARVLEAYVRMTLELGLFQADPHPGNLLATADDAVAVLDFGCAKDLTPEQRARLVALSRAFVARDAHAMAEALEALGFVTASGTLAGLRAYAETVLREIGTVRERGGDWPNQLELLSQVALMARFITADPVVRLPEEFVMLGRVFGTLSGLFLHYRPDVAAATRVMPLILLGLAVQFDTGTSVQQGSMPHPG